MSRCALFKLIAMGPCFYCGRQTYRKGPGNESPDKYTRDHLIPRRLRTLSLRNAAAKVRHMYTVTCCNDCNKKKGQKSVFEFRLPHMYTQKQQAKIEAVKRLNGGIV